MFIKQVNDEALVFSILTSSMSFDTFRFFPICLNYVAGGCSVSETSFINLLQGIL